jgi:uncharacterized membrane protein
MRTLTLATALSCGLVAGVYFTFSSFVMEGLNRLPPAQAIAAMQSINRMAVKPVFMTAFLGTGLACLWLGVWAVRSWGDRRAAWVLAGSALYVLGSIGVTGAANVPLNDKLDTVAPDGATAAGDWSGYLHPWIAWNHVRGITCLAAAALLTVALTKD